MTTLSTDDLVRLRDSITPATMGIISLVQKGFLPLRDCAICGAQIGYEIHPVYLAVVFNSACDCGGGAESYRLVDREEWAKFTAAPTTGEKP